MRVLLMGFGRWGPYKSNPSEQVVKALDGKKIGGAEIKSAVLPVDFKTLPRILKNSIEKYKPDVLITFGLSFRKLDSILLETYSRRVIHPSFPDNQGWFPLSALGPSDYDVLEGKRGPRARKSTLPIRNIQNALRKAKIPVYISKSAGRHMCEQVLYLAPHFMEEFGLHGLTGHIHLPHSPQAAKDVRSKKFLPLNKIVLAVRIIVKESVAKAKHHNL